MEKKIYALMVYDKGWYKCSQVMSPSLYTSLDGLIKYVRLLLNENHRERNEFDESWLNFLDPETCEKIDENEFVNKLKNMKLEKCLNYIMQSSDEQRTYWIDILDIDEDTGKND